MVAEYRPGVCNIGRAERRKRYLIGFAGFAVTAGFVWVYRTLPGPRWLLLASIVPLFVGFIGLYQGFTQFCVGFSRRRIYDVSDTGTERRSIEDDAAHAADRRRARTLNLWAAASATVAEIGLFLLIGP